MFRGSREIIWEDAYSVIDPAVRADALHEWPFDPAFPLDVRHFLLRGDADIRLNHHRYFEILYLVTGEITYEVAGARHPMRAGDLFVMSGLPHRIVEYGAGPIRCATLFFLPEVIRSQRGVAGDEVDYLMPFVVQDRKFPHVIGSQTGVPADVRSLMERIDEAMPCDSAHGRLLVRTYLKMILALLVNQYGDFASAKQVHLQRQRDLERLRPVFELIEQRYTEDVSIQNAADAASMSRSHFMRFFKQVTGQPFVSHLNQFRVAKAQHLLAATDRSIADISNDVGFGNQSYFGLVFRRTTNFCPREFQRIVHSDFAAAFPAP
jgi:AraC-like DNA-binding protein